MARGIWADDTSEDEGSHVDMNVGGDIKVSSEEKQAGAVRVDSGVSGKITVNGDVNAKGTDDTLDNGQSKAFGISLSDIGTDGYWYYLDPATGRMLTGWQTVGGKQYYLGAETIGTRSQGALYVNTTTPDGFSVNADGVRL